MDAVNNEGKPLSFSIRFVKKSTGELIDIDSAHLSRTPMIPGKVPAKKSTSTKRPNHYLNETRNIVIDSSDQIRKVCLRLITRVNNQPVYY